jgi:hypothetical protein
LTPNVFAGAPEPGSLASLVARPATDTQWFTGLPVAEDLHDWWEAVIGGGWIERILTTVGLGGDTVDLTIDLPGTLAAWAVSFLLEQIGPLTTILDYLGGNPTEVEKFGETLSNVARRTTGSAQRLSHTVQQVAWTGQAATGYQSTADVSRDAIASLGIAADGLSAAIRMLNLLVSVVRSIVRELISQCVASLAVRIPLWAAAGGAVTALTGGVASIVVLPALVAKVVAWIAACARKIRRWVRPLLASAHQLAGLLGHHLETLLNAVKSLLRRSPAGTPSVAPRPVGVDWAMAAAAYSRTPDGLVDEAVAARLAEALPRTDAADGVEAGLTRFVSAALGQDLTLTRVGGVEGRTGAPVRLVRDNTGKVVAVAKAFPQFDVFMRELSALERLRSPGFTRFHVPEAKAVGVLDTPDGPAGVLLTTVAPGRAVDDLFANVGNATGAVRGEHFATLSRSVQDTAAALAELHTMPAGTGRLVPASFIDFNAGRARMRVDLLLADPYLYEKLGGLPIDQLRQRLDDAIAASQSSPGLTALAHGDAHPGNVFWDETHGVTFIDTSDGHMSMDNVGRAIAAPERDIANFTLRIAQVGQKYGLEDGEVAQLTESFLGSYRDAGGAPPNDSRMKMFATRLALFDLVWKGREVRAALGDGGQYVPAADPALDSLVADLRGEVGLLKRAALGWE